MELEVNGMMLRIAKNHEEESRGDQRI
jgi:hypothetical protein